MAYTPTKWQCGDIFLLDRMNKIEQGVADISNASPLIVTISTDTVASKITYRLSHTFREIKEAYPNVLVELQLTKDGASGTALEALQWIRFHEVRGAAVNISGTIYSSSYDDYPIYTVNDSI